MLNLQVLYLGSNNLWVTCKIRSFGVKIDVALSYSTITQQEYT